MNTRIWIVALLWPLAALAATPPLLELTDPAGDDAGDGKLVYPRDSAFQPGDLDLRILRVQADGADLRFEARFANPVRHPSSVQARGLGNEALSVFARRGFYAFNLDIYVGTGTQRSGHTVSLPGRSAMFAPASAWDRVVVLTPRPELMRRQLRDALTEALPADAGAADAAIDAAVYFATAVRVSGRTVEFTVPRAFFNAGEVAEWSIAALVTQAKLTVETDLSVPILTGRAATGPSLGVQAPRPGRPEEAMGYDGDRAPATAVVDLLNSEPQAQARQLAAGGLLTGQRRGTTIAQAETTRPASEPSWFGRALLALSRGPAAAASPAAAPAPATSPAPPAPVPARAAAVEAPAAPPPVVVQPPSAPAKPAAPARARDAAFYEEQELRLQTLKRLREKGLISEAEYQTKRQEVLEKL